MISSNLVRVYAVPFCQGGNHFISDNCLLHTPLPLVPAKRFVPKTARELTSVYGGKPLLTAVQLAPLFVERKTPPKVPANRLVPKTAKDLTTQPP